MTTNAREFLEEIAEDLRAKGRKVEIIETEEPFGTFVWLSAPPQNWYNRWISLSAAHKTRTNRWSLGKLNVGASVGGSGKASKSFTKSTRTQIKISADVYG